MTNVEAQQISKYIAELEFPRMFVTSLQFALFQVSKISVQTVTQF